MVETCFRKPVFVPDRREKVGDCKVSQLKMPKPKNRWGTILIVWSPFVISVIGVQRYGTSVTDPHLLLRPWP